jgi:hypothetical protein
LSFGFKHDKAHQRRDLVTVPTIPGRIVIASSAAPSSPRHLLPQPKAPTISPRAGLDGVADALLFAQHAIEMFRRSLPDSPPRRPLDRLSNRLTKIISEARKLNPAG